jgi:hypothetical protein
LFRKETTSCRVLFLFSTFSMWVFECLPRRCWYYFYMAQIFVLDIWGVRSQLVFLSNQFVCLGSGIERTHAETYFQKPVDNRRKSRFETSVNWIMCSECFKCKARSAGWKVRR